MLLTPGSRITNRVGLFTDTALALKEEVAEKLANALTAIAKKAAGPYD